MADLERRIADLEKRIADLEEVIRRVPSYIDNWRWATENFDILLAIPGYEFPSMDLHNRALAARQKEKQS